MSEKENLLPGVSTDSYTDDNIYSEMAFAAGTVPSDRSDAIEEARSSRDVYSRLKLLEKMLAVLISSEQQFVIEKDYGDEVTLMLNSYGKYFAKHVQNFPGNLLEGKALSCRLEIFKDVVQNLGGANAFEALPAQKRYSRTVLADCNFLPKCRAGFVLRAVRDLRTIGNSRRFQTRQTNAQERSDAILAKMVAVIKNLFEVSSKLLVVRVDFEYRLDTRNHVTFKSAKQDLRKFFNNIRHQTQFNDLMGYIWEVEEGVFGGIHFHTFFFFCGSDAKRDIYYSIALGKYWVKVTEGRGTFHSCNAKKGGYRYLGIGMVSHADLKMHSALLVALQYLAASDKAQSIPGERTFGFSKPLTPTPKSLGGRPRTVSAASAFTGLNFDHSLEGDDA